MAKLAVDVVLLPSEQLADRAILVNGELLKQCPDKIHLDKEECLPHISLAMGCIDEEDIVDIEKILRTIAQQYTITQLKAAGVHVETNSAGEKVSILQVKRTESLQLLHERIMTEMMEYFKYDVTADMLLSSEKPSDSTLLWIKNYREKSSFENFSPHITLGYGQVDDFSFPTEFAVEKLALCHLGDHCTCRKVLASVIL